MKNTLSQAFYWICVILFFTGSNLAQDNNRRNINNHQRELLTYPFSISYINNGEFNFRVSQAIDRISSLEENSFRAAIQTVPFSFSVMRHYYDNSEVLYSLNPLLWAAPTLFNFLEPDRDSMLTVSMPFQISLLLLQVIPNLKFDLYLQKSARLSFGWDTDYYISSRNKMNISFCLMAGPKFSIRNFDFGFSFNFQAIAYGDNRTFQDKFLRLDISYTCDNDISRFIAYCRHIKKNNN